MIEIPPVDLETNFLKLGSMPWEPKSTIGTVLDLTAIQMCRYVVWVFIIAIVQISKKINRT